MERYRLEPLLGEGGLLPLGDLLAMDRDTLLRLDVETAGRFYAEAWAFLRYLRTGAGPEVAEKLALWEARCRGGAVGAEAGRPRVHDQEETARLFDVAFGGELDRLEAGFREWLRALAGG